MRFYVGIPQKDAQERLAERGVSRRDFMKYCGAVAAAMGMGEAFIPRVAEALTTDRRPSVVYLHNAECTGCSESVLRTTKPYMTELILNTISLDYHETIMAAAGHQAEEALQQAIESPYGYICVIEGGIPTAKKGIYGMVGGHTMMDICAKVAPHALANIAIGGCANFGGIQAAAPNPTGTVGVNEALGGMGVNAINVAGCPPNPLNFVGTIVYLLTHEMKAPAMDHLNRPLMFFEHTVHDRCERLPHFEAGRFAPSFESEEAKKGYCLYQLGCKGPITYNNCPTVKFNETNWPVEAGHPCIGCSEPRFFDTMTPFYEN